MREGVGPYKGIDAVLQKYDIDRLDEHNKAMRYARFLKEQNLIDEGELERIILQSQRRLNHGHLHTSFPFEEGSSGHETRSLYKKLEEKHTHESV